MFKGFVMLDKSGDGVLGVRGFCWGWSTATVVVRVLAERMIWNASGSERTGIRGTTISRSSHPIQRDKNKEHQRLSACQINVGDMRLLVFKGISAGLTCLYPRTQPPR